MRLENFINLEVLTPPVIVGSRENINPLTVSELNQMYLDHEPPKQAYLISANLATTFWGPSCEKTSQRGDN